MAGVAATVALVSREGTRVTVAAAEEDVWVGRGFRRPEPPPPPPRPAAKKTTSRK